MNILKCFVTLMLANFAVTLAANEKEMLVRVRPITRAQYDSIMKINDGKPLIPEGRLISSAISGLAGLAAGFQLGKYLPNIFGANNHNSKGSSVLGGYPLCTINTDGVTGSQNDTASYLNVDELTKSVVQQNDSSHDITAMNCILVLDDGKEKPSGENFDQTITTTTTTTVKPTHVPTNHPPHLHPPSHLPLPYPPFYPGYSYYPYAPASGYLPSQFYPIPYPPYVKYPIYDKDNDYEPEQDYDETLPSLESAVKLQTFLMNKLQAINALSSTTTTKKPIKKPSSRPASRPYLRPTTHPHYSAHSKPHRISFNENFDEDDSIDYIEVSKKFYH